MTIMAIAGIHTRKASLVTNAIILLAIILSAITGLSYVVGLLLIDFDLLRIACCYGCFSCFCILTANAMAQDWITCQASLETDTVHLFTTTFWTCASFALSRLTLWQILLFFSAILKHGYCYLSHLELLSWLMIVVAAWLISFGNVG